MDDLLELESRRNIYNLIQENPGLHLSKIAELSKLRISHVEYHLGYLEKHEVIVCIKEEGYRRYYVKETVGIKDKAVLALLRQEIPLKIVLYLLRYPRSLHKDILEHFDIAPSTLSYHLKKLQKRGIIDVHTTPKGERQYSVVDEKEMTRILMQFKPYVAVDSFAGIWEDLKVI